MPKILFISNISRRINSFSISSIKAAHMLNLDFIYCANWNLASHSQIEEDENKYDITISNFPISRNPFSLSNIKVFRMIRRFVRDNGIEYIHCNTPIGGLIGRMLRREKSIKKIIYQVHGFHFWNRAPVINWALYYPMEKLLAKKTDSIITINSYDYSFKNKFKLKHNGKFYCNHGVGIDTSRFETCSINRDDKRSEIGIAKHDIMMLSVGEYTKDKNHIFVMKNLPLLPDYFKFVICGDGKLRKKYLKIIKKLNLESRVILLGYRNDVPELLKACDLYLFPSTMEGLSRSLMEAIAAKVPIACSNIRGNVDLILNKQQTFDPNDSKDFLDCIRYITSTIQDENIETAFNNLEKYKTENVVLEMKKVYEETFCLKEN